MKQVTLDLQYRPNTYFNEKDIFVYEVMKDFLMVSRLKDCGPFWSNVSGLQYKMNSVRCVNLNDVPKQIEYAGLRGKLLPHLRAFGTKFGAPNEVRVFFYQGQQIPASGWVDINKIKFIDL